MPTLYVPVDIFSLDAEAIVNPVNCVGVMGAGLALAFKRRHPAHFASYRRACAAGTLRPGTVHVDDLGAGALPRYLIALPTKRHWRDPSHLGDVALSLRALARELRRRRISSVAIPKLGCGLGGLAWSAVHQVIVRELEPLADAGLLLAILSRPPAHPRRR